MVCFLFIQYSSFLDNVFSLVSFVLLGNRSIIIEQGQTVSRESKYLKNDKTIRF